MRKDIVNDKQMKKNVIYFHCGKMKIETYSIGNIEIRIEYYENDKMKSEHYYENGLLHREFGPSIILCDENGVITSKQYYLHGIKYK